MTAAKRKAPTDLELLQGTWRVTALESDGEEMAPPFYREATITLRGREFTSAGMGDDYTGTIELQPAKKPKAFDLAFTGGPPQGTRNLGIYKLDGDEWTICLATRGDDRPKTFTTDTDTGWVLETLRREGSLAVSKPAKAKAPRAAPPAPAPTGPPTEIEGEWQMVSAVFSGKPLAAEMVTWCKRITRGNITRITAGPQTMLDATFTLETTRTPRGIEYMNRSGSNKGKAQLGIFELAGEVLEICMAAPGDARPTELVSTKGDGRTYTSWRLIER